MVFDYYLVLLNKKSAKHNHKEMTAWGGLLSVVLYCSGVAGAGASQVGLRYRVSLTFCTVAVTVFVFLYLRNQLNLKNRASARIASATKILAEIICNSEFKAVRYLEMDPVASKQGSSSLPIFSSRSRKSGSKLILKATKRSRSRGSLCTAYFL